jgi:hypothetical protein
MSSLSSLGAASIGSSGAKKGAKALAAAINQATAEQKRQFEISREDQKPWRVTGQGAVNDLWKMIQQGPGDFYEDPGYKFRRAEGEKALERNAAARGSVLSGAQLKGWERYNQDYASNEYNNFLTRYYQSLNPYQSLAGLGQTGVANQNALGAQYSKMIGDNTIMGGQAQAGGYINQANAWMNGINNAVAGAASAGSMFGGGGYGGSNNAIYDYQQPIYNSGDYAGAGSAGWSAPAFG